MISHYEKYLLLNSLTFKFYEQKWGNFQPIVNNFLVNE